MDSVTISQQDKNKELQKGETMIRVVNKERERSLCVGMNQERSKEIWDS